MKTEAVPNEEVGECKKAPEDQGGLRLTFESVNKDYQEKVEMSKAKQDHENALNVLLQEFGLVEAYSTC